MAQVKKFNEHFSEYKASYDISLNEGWLSNLVKTLSAGASAVVSGFVDPFKKTVQDIKVNWKQGITADKIKKELKDTFTKSFQDCLKSLNKVKDENEINSIFNTLVQAIDKTRASLVAAVDQAVHESYILESYEQLVNYGSINEGKGEEIKNAVNALFGTVKKSFADTHKNFLDAVKKQQDLNAKVDAAKKELTNMFKTALNNIDKTDIKGMIRSGGSQNAGGAFKPGQTVKYTKKDGSEGEAVIDTDQSSATDNMHFVMKSLSKGTNFQIPKDKVTAVTKDVTNANQNDAGEAKVIKIDDNSSKEDIAKAIQSADDETLKKIKELLKTKSDSSNTAHVGKTVKMAA